MLAGDYPGCKREDIVWSLNVDREKAFVRGGGKSNSGETPAAAILRGISHLMETGKESGLNFGRKELLEAIEKLKFDFDKAEKWLNGVGTLMTRKAELSIVSREEVEAAMELHDLDDSKVIALFLKAAL